MEKEITKPRVCSLDIESNNLLAPSIDYTSLPYKLNKEAKLWCVVITDVETFESVVLKGKDLTKENMEKALLPYTTIVSHNGFKFDLIYLMLIGLLDYRIGYIGERDTLFGRDVRFIDTLIMSRLINPDRQNGHSLAAWGDRVGRDKMDYRGNLIKLGVIDKGLPKGEEFKFYHELMPEYCKEDTIVTALTYRALIQEYKEYNGWKLALQQEHKLADIAIRRETFGFSFDKELALKNISELTELMNGIQERVNPILPSKPLTKTELSNLTPPNTQFKKDETFSSHMINFLNRHGITSYSESGKYFVHNGNIFELPTQQPLYITKEATVDDLDVVKGYLLTLNWKPSEWAERDIMRDSKKQVVPLDKRLKSVERYVNETLAGKYEEHRLKELGLTEENMLSKLSSRVRDTKPVKVPTAPKIRVGVTKDMCPNLLALGDTVSFAKEVADYYTYRHRKSAIAGGDIEEMDFDEEVPNTGYLASYREEDSRISTPAIEIGASCVVKGSLLTTNKGLKCITEVSIDDKVLTHKGVYKRVIDKIDNGIKNVFKVTLENGLSLTCTSNHPFWTENGWVICEELDHHTNVYCYGEAEVWKSHPIFKNYQGSSTGRVRNMRGKFINPLTSKISGRPYTIDLYNGKGKKSRRSVGKFIIECFRGIVPEGLEVLHNDGNNTNNNLSNLRFGTSKENSADSILHGYVQKIRKTRIIKLTDSQVNEIRQFQKENPFIYGQDTKLSKIYNVSREYIRDIRKSKKRTLKATDSLYVEEFIKAKVVSVERLGVERTYDITVEEDHSYVVNSIVTHNTNRYKHIGVANVPRLSSLFGKEMRGLFGAGKDYIQFGFDYASLEARIEGNYVFDYQGGEELAFQLLAEKPNDIHTVTAKKLSIDRDSAKSTNYAMIYGASPNKFVKMLGYKIDEAKRFHSDWWEANPSLKELKEDKEKEWVQSGKKTIKSIDGRLINIRSQHSILNALFQSAGVICAKYITVLMFKRFEELGYCWDVFKGIPDIAPMIEYHDENQLAVKKELFTFKSFPTEEEAKEYKSDKQLGAVQKGKSGYYVTESNPVSEVITETIKEVEEMFKMKVNLGYEYVTGRNWADCH